MSFAEELRIIADEINTLEKNEEIIENIKEICINAATRGQTTCNILCDVNNPLKTSLKNLGLRVKYIYEPDICECSSKCSCDSKIEKGYILYW